MTRRLFFRNLALASAALMLRFGREEPPQRWTTELRVTFGTHDYVLLIETLAYVA